MEPVEKTMATALKGIDDSLKSIAKSMATIADVASQPPAELTATIGECCGKCHGGCTGSEGGEIG